MRAVVCWLNIATLDDYLPFIGETASMAKWDRSKGQNGSGRLEAAIIV
jgi:hypothetical protein